MSLFNLKKQNGFKKLSEVSEETAKAEWVYQLYQSQSFWLRWAIGGIFVLLFLLFLSIITNVMLFPLKTSVPFLYAFNNSTGEITKVGVLDPTKLDPSWQMSRFLIIRYVINRESYNFDDIDTPYQIAWAMSDPATVRSAYEKEVSSDAADSPYKVYGKDKYITVEVLDVSPLNKESAEVRFRKTLHDRSGGQQTSEKVAIIKWKYTDDVMTQKMLDRDPLGFKVIYYQVSQVNLDNNL